MLRIGRRSALTDGPWPRPAAFVVACVRSNRLSVKLGAIKARLVAPVGFSGASDTQCKPEDKSPKVISGGKKKRKKLLLAYFGHVISLEGITSTGDSCFHIAQHELILNFEHRYLLS